MSYKVGKGLYAHEKTAVTKYVKDHVLSPCIVIYTGNRNPSTSTIDEVKAKKDGVVDTTQYVTIGGMKYPPASAAEDNVQIMICKKQPTPTLLTNFDSRLWRSIFRRSDDYTAVSNRHITDVGLMGVSHIEHAIKIADLLMDYYPDLEILTSKTLTDATAGIGGNTLAFSKYVRLVNAIELDPSHAEILSQNVNILGVKNVSVYQGNFLDKIEELKQDILFIDPPLISGNSANKQLIEIGFCTTAADNKSVLESFKTLENLLRTKLANVAHVVMMKLPLNYNFDSFKNLRSYPFMNLTKVLSISGKPMYTICIVSKIDPCNKTQELTVPRFDAKRVLFKYIPKTPKVATTKKDKPVVKKHEVVSTQITKVPVVKTPAPTVSVAKPTPKVLTTSKIPHVVDQHEDDEDDDEMEEEVVEVQTFD